MEGSDIELVARTAALARLAIDEGEARVLGPQFAAILDHLRALAELDVEDEEPMFGPAPLGPLLRDDEPAESTPREQLLAAAPDRRDGFYGVPKTIGGAP